MKKVEMAELRAVVAGGQPVQVPAAPVIPLPKLGLDLNYSITLPIFGYGKLQIGFGTASGFGWNLFGVGTDKSGEKSFPVLFTSADFKTLIKAIFDFF